MQLMQTINGLWQRRDTFHGFHRPMDVDRSGSVVKP